MKKAVITRTASLCCVLTMAVMAVVGQKAVNTETSVGHILWEPVEIGQRDLYLGPGGTEFLPTGERWTFIGPQVGGNNVKYRIKDGTGRVWIAKIADESQPEVAAVRLLWAVGYPTEINYIVPQMSIDKKGAFKNVRVEARPDKVKRLEQWSWNSNPFGNKNEFYGLKLMMAMFNNWDIKDENNVILHDGNRHYYVVSDLGASFGKTADEKGGRAGRSVNDPEDYSKAVFIKGVRNGHIELAFNTYQDHLIHGVKVEHGRWLADLLIQLSDKQIADAFRAANYKPEDVTILARAFRNRINELDAATKPIVAIQ